MTIANATCFDATISAIASSIYRKYNTTTKAWVEYTYNGAGINDLYLTNLDSSLPDFATSYGYNGMVLSVKRALQLWKEEYVFNTTEGISYNYMLGNNFVQKSYVYTQIYTTVMNCNNYLNATQLASYGIETINNIAYTIDRKHRIANISMELFFYGSNSSVLLAI